ncbi:hypothetical protein [Planctomicrobium sp. SH664]|uniref:hypothetical protein n=1 Tax=Planctomicrobium sp. SH664 TaxID=3448125 RepID=UPI003F5B3E53
MLIQQLLKDDSGFIVSAELVLISTLVVLGMIVGLSEVQHAVVSELNDVGDALGSLNQSYYFGGLRAWKTRGWGGGWGWGGGGGFKSMTVGSAFTDYGDSCDWNQCALSCDGPVSEAGKGFGGGLSYATSTCGGFVTGATSGPVSSTTVVTGTSPVSASPAPTCSPILSTPTKTVPAVPPTPTPAAPAPSLSIPPAP